MKQPVLRHRLITGLPHHPSRDDRRIDEAGDAAGVLVQHRGWIRCLRTEESLRRAIADARGLDQYGVDYAILEPRSAKGEQDSKIFCLRADFGWNDLGSWTALHEHGSAKDPAADGNLISAQGIFTADANRNYVHAPGKFVAVIGVNDVVVVETEDALLVTTRESSQDVGKVVKYLDEKKLKRLV